MAHKRGFGLPRRWRKVSGLGVGKPALGETAGTAEVAASVDSGQAKACAERDCGNHGTAEQAGQCGLSAREGAASVDSG